MKDLLFLAKEDQREWTTLELGLVNNDEVGSEFEVQSLPLYCKTRLTLFIVLYVPAS